MNLLGKLIFFLSANSPVLLMWAVFQYCSNFTFAIILLSLALVSYLMLFFLFRNAKKRQHKQLFNLSVENNVNSEMMEYMVSYILPFISLNKIDSWETPIALCIYYIVLFGIYLRSDVFYVNPILNLVGYNIYKIKYIDESKEKIAFLISKHQQHEIPEKISVMVIERNIFIYNGD